ncbi:MAG: MBL fold metallo-hydrolase [Kofleriaceae bacterium]|nr:MBL fold metallo-hydrolase [Kofleriaceae bacterium]
MKARITVALVLLSIALGSWKCGVFRTPEPVASHLTTTQPQSNDDIEVIWIGHATALIRLGDTWVLSDPVFNERIGLVYKRYVEPGRTIEELPALDAILLSHPHLDHLDADSLRKIVARNPKVPIVGTANTLKHLPDDLKANAVRIKTWENTRVGSLRISSVPAHHGNGRWIVDGIWNHKSAAGFVLEEKGHTVYFAGDTGYHSQSFKDIGQRFKIDVAILPVGPAGRPEWVHSLRKSVHASPKDAMRMFDDLQADYMVPVHFGTFFKPRSEEIADIESAIAESALASNVALLSAGESVVFQRSDHCPPKLSCMMR